jgi:hypothetical protein
MRFDDSEDAGANSKGDSVDELAVWLAAEPSTDAEAEATA